MKDPSIERGMYKLRDLEVELNVSRETLYRWRRKGIIKSVTLPTGHIRVPREEVERLRHGI
jgi:excisionase family DNA binding protein